VNERDPKSQKEGDRRSGLPDGLVSNQKFQFGQVLEALGMENTSIFNFPLKYCIAIWYKLWPFDIVCSHLVFFHVLVSLVQEKSGNPVAGRPERHDRSH
jgi:antitoxin component of RelBE/YafQ-DinJ toxin-antitoxin module